MDDPAKKHDLLKNLTQKKEQYVDKLPNKQKEALHTEIATTRSLFSPTATKPPTNNNFIFTGIQGFDKLMKQGIPKGTATLVAGGPGSGKTIFCLQLLAQAAEQGKKCLYMSFEEKESRLEDHMKDFGWKPKELEKKGLLKIKRYDPFEITRSVEAMLEKAKGELLIDVQPVLFPEGFKPQIVIVDSLSSISASFYDKGDAYRVYVEQLFRLFEDLNLNSFFIYEISEKSIGLGEGAVEQFLADNVFIIYNIRKKDIRESAIEIFKMRGAQFQKKIVALQILEGKGIEVYPDQKVYSDT